MMDSKLKSQFGMNAHINRGYTKIIKKDNVDGNMEIDND